MKSMKRILVLAMLVVSLLAISVPSLATTGRNFVVCPLDETVRVRDSAGGNEIGVLNNGIPVTVISESGGWSRISHRLYSNGYMMSSYLSTSTPAWMSRYGDGVAHLNNSTQVKALQTDLNEYFGYYRLAVDGIWGPATETAVLDFQHDFAFLIKDGIAGPETKAFLYNKTHIN